MSSFSVTVGCSDVVFDNTDLSDAVTVAGDQKIVTSVVRSILCDVVKMSLYAR